MSQSTARSFDIVDCQQGTPEWEIARCGRVTGSCANIVMMKELPSGGEPAGKKDYRLQLAVERITGRPQMDDFQNRHTRRGNEQEPLARVAVERRYGIVICESGFLRHKEKMIGVSLDGHTRDFCTIAEMKCPKSTTHVEYLRMGKLPAAYRWQVIHGLYVSGAERCIFASYDNRMPEGMELFSIDVKAKDLPLEEYGTALDSFLASVVDEELKLKNLKEKYRGIKYGG